MPATRATGHTLKARGATVIGIAGCTALLLTGFGLKNSISDVLAKQYGPIYHYDTIVGFDEGALDQGAEEGTLAQALDDRDSPASYTHVWNGTTAAAKG